MPDNCTSNVLSAGWNRGEVRTALYGGYRGEEYFRPAISTEFWYTRGFNDWSRPQKEEADPYAAGPRKLLYAHGRHWDLGSIGFGAGHGGDRGQILAQGPGQRRYVFGRFPEPSP